MHFLQTEYAHHKPKTTEEVQQVWHEFQVYNGIEGFIYQVRVPVWRFLFTSGVQL